VNDFSQALDVVAPEEFSTVVALRLTLSAFVVCERVGHDVVAIDEYFLEFVHDVSIVIGQEAHRRTLATGATGATDAVRLVFNRVR